MKLFSPLDRIGLRIAFLCFALIASATDIVAQIFVAPRTAEISSNADGSESAPYGSLDDAIKARGKRDIPIVFMDGQHDAIRIRGNYSPPLTITAQTPAGAYTPVLVVRSPGTHVSNLGVWPEAPVEKHYVLVTTNADNVVVEGLDIRGSQDAKQEYFNWTKEEWLTDKHVNGVKLKGRNVTFRNNTVTGTAFAIQSYNEGARVLNNRVSGFSGDALRGLGDDTIYYGNFVENSFDVDKNHDDGFQSWAPKVKNGGSGILKNLVLDSNVIIGWTGPEKHPLRGKLQGIGLFDGRFENVTIQNNLVLVNHYHGISLYDGFDSKIVNNTVAYLSGPPQRFPWIKLGSKRKNPEAYRHVLIANNAAMSYSGSGDALKRNVVTKYIYKFYEDPSKLNFEPKEGSPLIGAGLAEFAPGRDILGRERAKTGRVTLGAFEAQ